MTNIAKLQVANQAVIEKGVPIPDRPRRGQQFYPWLEMEVGDSFMLRTNLLNNASATVRTANQRYAPKQFIYRRVAGGFRCWRTA